MVIRQIGFAEIGVLERQLVTLESKALPLFENTLANNDIDARRRSICSYSRFKTQLKVLSIKYTLGHDLKLVQLECEKLIEFLDYLLDNLEQPLDVDFDQYELIVWALSCGSLFNVEFSKDLISKLPYSQQDMLIDRLIHCFNRAHIPTQKILFPRVHKPLCEALGRYDTNEFHELITSFLNNYFTGLSYYDAFWCDSLKEKDPRYYRHFGYWVFELGALVADIDWWDDSGFRDHPLYPKDLVDWKRAHCST